MKSENSSLKLPRRLLGAGCATMLIAGGLSGMLSPAWADEPLPADSQVARSESGFVPTKNPLKYVNNHKMDVKIEVKVEKVGKNKHKYAVGCVPSGHTVVFPKPVISGREIGCCDASSDPALPVNLSDVEME